MLFKEFNPVVEESSELVRSVRFLLHFASSVGPLLPIQQENIGEEALGFQKRWSFHFVQVCSLPLIMTSYIVCKASIFSCSFFRYVRSCH